MCRVGTHRPSRGVPPVDSGRWAAKPALCLADSCRWGTEPPSEPESHQLAWPIRAPGAKRDRGPAADRPAMPTSLVSLAEWLTRADAHR